MTSRNKGGGGNRENRRMNSNSNLEYSQIPQQQNVNPISNQQSENFTSFSSTSSVPFMRNQNQDLSQYPNLVQSPNQNQVPIKIPKKRGRKPKPKPTDQNLTVGNSTSSPSLMNTRTRSSSQNQINGNNRNDGENGSEDDEESEYDPQDNEGMPIDAILCKTQFPFQPSIQNFATPQNRNGANINANVNNPPSQSSNISNMNNQNNALSRSSSAQSFDPNEPQFLVEMSGQSPIHSFVVCEHSIKNGSQSGKLYNEFKKSCEYNKVKISSVGIEFLEPCSMEKLVNVDSFEIDQIIAHRTFESETKFMEKLMDNNLHIPGLPTDLFPPNFEEAFKYSNTFSENQNEVYSMLREDGFFSLDGDLGNNNKILTKELFREFEHENNQQNKNLDSYNDENNNENINGNSNDVNDNDLYYKIPEKIEFKIQWKDLPASESTWESYESLMNSINLYNDSIEQEDSRSNNNIYNKYLINGTIIKQKLFCPTNMDDLDNIIRTYWSRVVILGEKNGPLSSNSLNQKDDTIPIEEVPSDIPSMCRQTILTEFQQNIIKQLFEYKINFVNNQSYENDSNGLCQLLQMKDSGRVFAVVGFLQMLYSIYHFTKPTLIIVNDSFSHIWKDALKSISNLFWVDFTGSSSDRMMIKHHRLDKNTRFDVLITNCHVLEKEAEFLKNYQWDNIIIDDVHLREDQINSQILHVSNEFSSNITTRKRRGRKPKKFNHNSVIGYNNSNNNDEYSSNEKESESESENEDQNESENEKEKGNNDIDDENENTKNESKSIWDKSLTVRSHSLSVLASSLLKNRSIYNSRNKRKNSSPFVILMNDLFSFAPVFNQMNPINDLIPFHFTETIFIVPNLISQYTSKKLSILFKKRAARVLNMSKAVDILHELVLSLQHPFVIPEVHQELLGDFMSSRGLSAQRMNPSIELEFLRSICGKLTTLDELTIGTRERSLSITVIVAEDLAILKLLRLYFVMRRIPAGIVNTNVAIERVPDDFAYGILLMSREITHPLIDKFTISQIVFYDVSTSYKKDLDFIQFITRQQNLSEISIYRLLTKHSIETELFIKTTLQPKSDSEKNLHASFDYRELTIRNVEPLIRVAVLAAKEAEKEREEETASYSQFQFSFQPPAATKKVESVTSFPFQYPSGNSSLSSILNSLMSQTERDEFWAFAYQSSTVSKTELTDFSNYVYNFEDQDENEEENKNNDNQIALLPEYRLYIELMKNGMNNWEKIASQIEKPLEEVRSIGQAMVLKMLSSVKPADIFNFTLASNIYWFEYSDTFANGHQLDEPEFWMRIAGSKTSRAHSPLFMNACFNVSQQANNANSENTSRTVFDGFVAERNLRYFEENYIVRAFLSIRSHPYIPARLLAKKGSVMYTPDYIHAFLGFFASHTGDWESIKAKFRLNLYSTEAVIGYFKELYDAVFTDVFSFVVHNIYSGQREVLVQNRMIWPLFQLLEKGPFTLNWTEEEVNVVTNVLSNFHVPLAGQSTEDWCEFHSLTRMITKSTESVEFLTSYLVSGISELAENSKFVIIGEITMSDPITISPAMVKKLKLRMSALSCFQQLSREEKLKEFKPQVSLPDGWTVEDDLCIIKGICQFGYSRLFDLGKVNVELYSEQENGQSCPVMDRDLSQFAAFVADKSAFLMRLKLIVTSNAQINDGKATLISEQLSDTVNKVNVLHRRGRPPNPNKHRDVAMTSSSSTSHHVGRPPKSSYQKVAPVNGGTSNIFERKIEQGQKTETDAQEAPPIQESEEAPSNKTKKSIHMSKKQQKMEDETGFQLDNDEGEGESEDDDEYGENDSDENEFDRRLRARPMATRARTSLESGANAVMQTRNQLKKQQKTETRARTRRQSQLDDINNKEQEQEQNEIIMEIEVEDSQKVVQQKVKEKTQVQKPKPKPKPVAKPPKDGVNSDAHFEEVKNDEDSSRTVKTRRQTQKVRKIYENEDEEDFVDFDEDDEMGGNAIRMQTRSRIPRRSNVQMKTRNQQVKQTPVKKESENKPKKVKEKRYKKIAFIFDPLPESIKFTPE